MKEGCLWLLSALIATGMFGVSFENVMGWSEINFGGGLFSFARDLDHCATGMRILSPHAVISHRLN
jgi:hypothetical protein